MIRLSVKCKKCNKKFEQVRRNHFFCSKKCWEKFNYKSQINYSIRIRVQCKNCGKLFTKKYLKAKFCSRNCNSYSGIRKWPIKVRARKLLNYYLSSKQITRPDICESCGRKCVPHGHHDDYKKPRFVKWLCPKCHYVRHHSEQTSSLNRLLQANASVIA